MANIRFYSGVYESLPETITSGHIYFVSTDEDHQRGQIYFDKDNKRYLMQEDINVAFGTCGTAGDIANKEVVLIGNSCWKPKSGSLLYIRFTNTNTCAQPTLTVYHDDEKTDAAIEGANVFYNGDTLESYTNYGGEANVIIQYVYDGINFNFVSWSHSGDFIAEFATNVTAGCIKSYVYHTVAANGPTPTSSSTQVTVNDITTVDDRYYAVETDAAGHAFVNVPWEVVLQHTITIGDQTFDGSSDITVETFSGDVNS